MLDFGASPPEVTSAQMYTGPGSGPMMMAARAWDVLAAQLNFFAKEYDAVLAGLEGQQWTGPAADAMAAAAAPYVQWATTTGLNAEHAASQARAATIAFETAHASVVPPALVAANRTQLANLVATNTFGQNAAHIGATEAQYAGMWAQNTHAMYSYAGSASAASKVSPFSQPPQTTNPAGQAMASSAAAGSTAGTSQLQNLLSSITGHLQGLSTPATSGTGLDQLTSDVGTFNTLTGPTSFVLGEMRTVGNVGSFAVALGRVFADGVLYAPLTGLLGGDTLGLGALPTAGLSSAVSSGSTGVLASTGSAGAVGQLSVPKAWADATPVASLASAEEPMWLWEAEHGAGHPGAGLSGASLPAGIPTEGMAAAAGMMIGRASVSNVLKVPPRKFKMSRPSSGG